MVRCKPYKIRRTVNAVQGLHIHELHLLIIGYITQRFRNILQILINTSAGALFSVVTPLGNAVIRILFPKVCLEKDK